MARLDDTGSVTVTLSDRRATSSLTGKPISADQLEHLARARELAVVARRERQLTRMESKVAELRAFLDLGERVADASLTQALDRWAKALCDLEDKHRAKLQNTVERQNAILLDLQTDLRRLSPRAAPGSVVSSVAPTRPPRAM